MKSKVELEIRAIRESMKHGDYDIALAHSRALSGILQALHDKPDRTGRKLTAGVCPSCSFSGNMNDGSYPKCKAEVRTA